MLARLPVCRGLTQVVVLAAGAPKTGTSRRVRGGGAVCRLPERNTGFRAYEDDRYNEFICELYDFRFIDPLRPFWMSSTWELMRSRLASPLVSSSNCAPFVVKNQNKSVQFFNIYATRIETHTSMDLEALPALVTMPGWVTM